MIKGLLLSICISLFAFPCLAQGFGEADFPYDLGEPVSNASTDIGEVLKGEVVENENSLLLFFADLFGLGDSIGDEDDVAVNFVLRVVNIILGLVSFVALAWLLFTFLKLFFGKSEGALSGVGKTITGIAIAIALIGISWFVVSYLFRVWGGVK